MQHERGLRVDAARNHERIVVAAAHAFEEDGPAVPLEEIARRAGVGVATVYRRFGGRDQLVQAVLRHVFATEVEPAVVSGGPDPWADLVATLTATVEAVAAHRVLVALAKESATVRFADLAGYLEAVDRVLGRARAAGVVRPELTGRDVVMAVVMLLAVGRMTGNDPADLRRYLTILADGMRPGPAPLPPARC